MKKKNKSASLPQFNRVLIFAPTFNSGSQKCNCLALAINLKANKMGLLSSLMAKAEHRNVDHPELKHGVKQNKTRLLWRLP